MHDKYLPIGSVCTVRGIPKKVMVTGYFSVEYVGQVKMYDYKGCDYPEGLLLSNKNYSFNHTDIEQVNFVGFENETYHQFQENLIGQQQNQENSNFQEKNGFANIKFDENGVVIYDAISLPEHKSAIVKEEPVTEEKKIDNPFTVQYPAPKTDTNNTSSWSIFKNIEFDENGVVTVAEEYTPEELAQQE